MYIKNNPYKSKLSFECTEGTRANQIASHQHIVFLDEGENPSLFELEEKYVHPSGIFNYVRITVVNVFDEQFLMSYNVIYAINQSIFICDSIR